MYQEPNPEKIYDLVVDGRYMEALLTIPKKLRGIKKVVKGTRRQVRDATSFITEDDFQQAILDAVEGEDYSRVAALLKMKQPTKGEKPKPEYQHAFSTINNKVESSKYEELAAEWNEGENEYLRNWLKYFKEKYQIPSDRSVCRSLAQASVNGYMRAAQEKIKNREPLEPKESDAYYYHDRSMDDAVRKAEFLEKNKNFDQIIEYVTVELLDSMKAKTGIRRVLKAPIEEDVFRGADIIVQQNGHWLAVDITLATSQWTLGEKRYQKRRSTQSLPTTERFLNLQPGTIQSIIKELPGNFMQDFAFEYLSAIKKGETINIQEYYEKFAHKRKGLSGMEGGEEILRLAA